MQGTLHQLRCGLLPQEARDGNAQLAAFLQRPASAAELAGIMMEPSEGAPAEGAGAGEASTAGKRSCLACELLCGEVRSGLAAPWKLSML